LVKAREGFVEKTTMDEEVAKLTKSNAELAKELAAARSSASTWEGKALTAERQVKKDRLASDGVIREQATKYKELEEAVLKDCCRILGKLFWLSFYWSHCFFRGPKSPGELNFWSFLYSNLPQIY
jgi:CTP-dependent riboflavin kinase